MAKHEKKSSGTGKGLISKGDNYEYMGHFRNADVLKKGHNQGAPAIPGMGGGSVAMPPVSGGGGMQNLLASPAMNPISKGAGAGAGTRMPRIRPSFDAALNPVLAQRQQERQAGTLGTVAGRAQMRAARSEASQIPRAQRRATATAARVGAREERAGARAMGRQAQSEAVGAARTGLQSATAGVRAARQGLRSAVRGGDVSGAATAAQGLQAARGARRTAVKGLRQARR